MILSKTIKINNRIMQHKYLSDLHKIINVSNYNDKCEIIDYIFRNISITLHRVTTHHQYMVDFLMQELVVHNSLLKFCISLISYHSYKIRMYIVQFFNNIFAEDSIRNIDLCIEYGYLEEISNCFDKKSNELSKLEISNIILSLSNLLSSEYKHRIKVLNNENLLQIIFDNLYHNDIHVVMACLYCLNNVLELKEEQTSNILLNYKNGKIINAICLILKMDNVQWDKMKMDQVLNVTNLLKNIVSCMIINFVDNDWVCQRFKREDIVNILTKLKLIKKSDANDNTIDVIYLKQLALKQYTFYLQHLLYELSVCQ